MESETTSDQPHEEQAAAPGQYNCQLCFYDPQTQQWVCEVFVKKEVEEAEGRPSSPAAAESPDLSNSNNNDCVHADEAVVLDMRKKYNCPKANCTFETFYHQNMIDHIRVFHEVARESKYICKYCLYSTDRLGKFRAHILNHLPCKCKSCNYSVMAKGFVKAHSLTAQGAPYQCPYCSHTSASKRNLSAHVATVHTENGHQGMGVSHGEENDADLDLMDLIDSYNGFSRSDSGQGSRASNGNVSSSMNLYACSVCPKKFCSQNLLRSHMNDHA